MNYSYDQNKEFAIKLVIMKVEQILKMVTAINRGDYTNKDLKKIIKKYEIK